MASQRYKYSQFRISTLMLATLAVGIVLLCVTRDRIDTSSIRRDLGIPTTTLIEVVRTGTKESEFGDAVEYAWFVQMDTWQTGEECRLIGVERLLGSPAWMTPEVSIYCEEGQMVQYPYSFFFNHRPSHGEISECIAYSNDF
ncbi:MAG: hypothetical protein AAGG48_31175 [Planctomycetota bacterium]